MTIRTIALLATAALVGGAFAGSASAASASSLTTLEEGIEDRPIVGPVTKHCGSARAGGARSLARVSSRDAAECAITQSCRRVDVPKTHRTLLRFVAFRVYQWIRWCWRYPRVLSSTTGVYLRDVDPNWRYGGIVARYKQSYTWCCRRRNSGVVSFVQARFDNCLPWAGCIGTVYPWLRIRVHANGTFTSATGS